MVWRVCGAWLLAGVCGCGAVWAQAAGGGGAGGAGAGGGGPGMDLLRGALGQWQLGFVFDAAGRLAEAEHHVDAGV